MPSPAFTLRIFESELKEIENLVLQYENIETGGDLFGLWTRDTHPVVQLIIGPGKDCRRTSVSFHQDTNYLQNVGTYLNTSYMLCHMGSWHSHHQLSLIRPSTGDHSTVRNNFPAGLERYIMIIANIVNNGTRSAANSVVIHPYMFSCKGHVCEEGAVKIVYGQSPFREDFHVSNEIRQGAEGDRVIFNHTRVHEASEASKSSIPRHCQHLSQPRKAILQTERQNSSVLPETHATQVSVDANQWYSTPSGQEKLQLIYAGILSIIQNKNPPRDSNDEVVFTRDKYSSDLTLQFTHNSCKWAIEFPRTFDEDYARISRWRENSLDSFERFPALSKDVIQTVQALCSCRQCEVAESRRQKFMEADRSAETSKTRRVRYGDRWKSTSELHQAQSTGGEVEEVVENVKEHNQKIREASWEKYDEKYASNTHRPGTPEVLCGGPEEMHEKTMKNSHGTSETSCRNYGESQKSTSHPCLTGTQDREEGIFEEKDWQTTPSSQSEISTCSTSSSVNSDVSSPGKVRRRKRYQGLFGPYKEAEKKTRRKLYTISKKEKVMFPTSENYKAQEIYRNPQDSSVNESMSISDDETDFKNFSLTDEPEKTFSSNNRPVSNQDTIEIINHEVTNRSYDTDSWQTSIHGDTQQSFRNLNENVNGRLYANLVSTGGDTENSVWSNPESMGRNSSGSTPNTRLATSAFSQRETKQWYESDEGREKLKTISVQIARLNVSGLEFSRNGISYDLRVSFLYKGYSWDIEFPKLFDKENATIVRTAEEDSNECHRLHCKDILKGVQELCLCFSKAETTSQPITHEENPENLVNRTGTATEEVQGQISPHFQEGNITPDSECGSRSWNSSTPQSLNSSFSRDGAGAHDISCPKQNREYQLEDSRTQMTRLDPQCEFEEIIQKVCEFATPGWNQNSKKFVPEKPFEYQFRYRYQFWVILFHESFPRVPPKLFKRDLKNKTRIPCGNVSSNDVSSIVRQFCDSQRFDRTKSWCRQRKVYPNVKSRKFSTH